MGSNGITPFSGIETLFSCLALSSAAHCSNGITPFSGIETLSFIRLRCSSFRFERYYPILGDWNFSLEALEATWVLCSNGITPFSGIETNCCSWFDLFNEFRSNGITPFSGIETSFKHCGTSFGNNMFERYYPILGDWNNRSLFICVWVKLVRTVLPHSRGP